MLHRAVSQSMRRAAAAVPTASSAVATSVSAAPAPLVRAFSSLRAAGAIRRTAAAAQQSSSSLAASSCPGSCAPLPSRSLCTGRPLLGLEEFFINQQAGRTGRSWNVRDLRRKGWPDLQKLWFVLLKERNMLYTYKHQSESMGERMEDQHRIRKVRQSMKAIKVVLGERYRWYKEQTDQGWVNNQARLAAKRRDNRDRFRARSSLRPGQRPRVPGGMPKWQLNKAQKYAYLKPRPADQPAPEGSFPARMVQPASGHGQAPADLFKNKVKRDTEYF